ncbi:MAG: S-methyl-5-thioribose-1-phosphate isomerase [Bacteroidota bacterium]
MRVDGEHFRSVWVDPNKDEDQFYIIDQRPLPHSFEVATLTNTDAVAIAIKDMWVRGAPLIGVTAAFGYWLALKEAITSNTPETYLAEAKKKLLDTRPTAVNLEWAIQQMDQTVTSTATWGDKIRVAKMKAIQLADQDAEVCAFIGDHGLQLIEKIAATKGGEPVNILTHCNAGWLACVDWGTATAPMYKAFEKGINIHVWVDETRPRNQGARLTAWELQMHGIPHTVIVDNAGGHLMQHGMVDLCLVGTDRTTARGDVANKIGTYLKALAAKDNQVPFYVALPSSTIDWSIQDGLAEIPIETRSDREVKYIWGQTEDQRKEVLLTPTESPASNYAFDVTPARLISGLITEKGICPASEAGLKSLFPERFVHVG